MSIRRYLVGGAATLTLILGAAVPSQAATATTASPQSTQTTQANNAARGLQLAQKAAATNATPPPFQPGEWLNGKKLATPPRQGGQIDTAPVGKAALKGQPPKEAKGSSGGVSTLAACSSPCYIYDVGSEALVNDGVTANVTIAKPYLKSTDHHSLAEVAVQSADGQQIIEMGWTVDRTVNGSCTPAPACKDDPHLFVFHWVNGVPSVYNGGGWVDYAGTAINVGSSLASSVSLTKQMSWQYFAGNWWAGYDNQWLGYFPGTLWSAASPSVTFDKSSFQQFFGELATAVDKPCSDMGTGTAGTTSGTVARISSVAYMISGAWFTGVNLYQRTSPSVHNTAYPTNSVSGRSFYYGGPGWNSAGTVAPGTTGGC